MIRRLLLLLLILVVIAGAVLFWAVGMPASGRNQEVFVNIPPGTGTSGIARQLEESGVVEGSWQFLLARALRPGVTLKAGEYRFDQPMTAWAVLDKIARGDIFYHLLRIPEGANIFDIAEVDANAASGTRPL